MKGIFTLWGLTVSSCLLVSPPDEVAPELTLGGGPSTGGAGASGAGTGRGGVAGSIAAGGAKTASGGRSADGADTASNTGGRGGAATTNGGQSGGGTALMTFPCAAAKPASALITSFADPVPNSNHPGDFIFVAGVPGGTYSYSPGALTLTVAEQALNIKGTVSKYDGFGFYINKCADASAYTGVSFNIKGNVGPSNLLDFRIQTNSNTSVDVDNMKGSCLVPTGTLDPYPYCHAASASITAPATGGVVNVKFSSLYGGLPNASVTAKDIVGFEWAFTMPGSGISYSVDVTIDDLHFTSGAPAGTGGVAGTGGAAAGSGSVSSGAGGT